MAQTVPLIRTAAMLPWVNWLRANGRPVAERLGNAGLSFLDTDCPNAPIPFLLLLEFIRQQARLEGDDIGYRIVSGTSITELANLGAIALSARTPKASFVRIARYLPRHCSHEVITVADVADGLTVSEHWLLTLDDEILHLIQQYVVALLLAICRLARTDAARTCRVEMVPHPVRGLAHLAPQMGTNLQAASASKLSLWIPNAVACARLPDIADPDRDDQAPTVDWTKLRERGVLSNSVEVAIAAMLPGGAMSVDQLARCAGMSPRTFQRRLASEGTSLNELVERTRRRIAFDCIASSDCSFDDLARDLGYANASALTRAVRRWAGTSPRSLRIAARDRGDSSHRSNYDQTRSVPPRNPAG